jgi:hypothetical protein
LAKHITFPAEFKAVQSGSPPAIPPTFRNPFQTPPAKRFTSVAPLSVNMEQITPLASSLVQLGVETAVVVRFANALQVVPLNRDHAISPFELLQTSGECLPNQVHQISVDGKRGQVYISLISRKRK